MKYFTAFIQYIVTVLSRPIYYFFFRFKVEGRENIPEDTAVIFAVNHTSKLDPFTLCAAIPLSSRHLPTYFVAREKRFYTHSTMEKVLYGGWLFKLLGAYPAYHGNKDYEHALREHANLLEEGKSVCIYPEGGLARNGHKMRSRGGVAYLASKAKIPVIPVYIENMDLLTWKDFWLRRRQVTVTFGEPQYFKGRSVIEAFRAFAQLVVGAIYGKFKKKDVNQC